MKLLASKSLLECAACRSGASGAPSWVSVCHHHTLLCMCFSTWWSLSFSGHFDNKFVPRNPQTAEPLVAQIASLSCWWSAGRRGERMQSRWWYLTFYCRGGWCALGRMSICDPGLLNHGKKLQLIRGKCCTCWILRRICCSSPDFLFSACLIILARAELKQLQCEGGSLSYQRRWKCRLTKIYKTKTQNKQLKSCMFSTVWRIVTKVIEQRNI